MKILLDREKIKKVDLKKYYDKYSGNGYKILKGAPMIINIEGTYVYINDLPKAVHNKKFSFFANQYVVNLKIGYIPDLVIFKWYRGV